jgi:hypothetical protein
MLVLSDKHGGQIPLSVQHEHQTPAGDTALLVQREYVYHMHILEIDIHAGVLLYCSSSKSTAGKPGQYGLAGQTETEPSCTHTPAQLGLLRSTISIILFFLRRAIAAVHSACGERTGKVAKLGAPPPLGPH